MLYLELDHLSADGTTRGENFSGNHGSLEKSTKMKKGLDKCEALLRISQLTNWFLSRGKKA